MEIDLVSNIELVKQFGACYLAAGVLLKMRNEDIFIKLVKLENIFVE